MFVISELFLVFMYNVHLALFIAFRVCIVVYDIHDVYVCMNALFKFGVCNMLFLHTPIGEKGSNKTLETLAGLKQVACLTKTPL